MQLDQHLSAIYSLPGFTFPKGPDGEKLVAPDILQKEVRGEYRAACKVIELPRDAEKPNPQGLQAICHDFQVDPKDVLVIGDSVKKDIAVARAVGAVDAWAEYGTYVSLEYRERLDIISAPAITRRHAAGLYEGGQKKAIEPTHTLSNFSQVLGLIDARR
jgi:phosphoglycolate phosphatase